MKWLVTTKATVSKAEVEKRLKQWGCEVEEAPIPLDADEMVFAVSGPGDLPDRIEGDDAILKVSPNSELTLY